MSGIYQAKAASPRLLPDRSGVYLALTLRMRRFFLFAKCGKKLPQMEKPCSLRRSIDKSAFHCARSSCKLTPTRVLDRGYEN